MRPTVNPPHDALQDAASTIPSDPSAAPELQPMKGAAPPSAKGVITPSSGACPMVTPAAVAAPAAEYETASLSEGDLLQSRAVWINSVHSPCTASCCGS